MEAAERDEFYLRQQFNAKHPQKIFSEALPNKAVPIYLQRSLQLYEELEELRLKGKAQ